VKDKKDKKHFRPCKFNKHIHDNDYNDRLKLYRDLNLEDIEEEPKKPKPIVADKKPEVKKPKPEPPKEKPKKT